MRHVHRMASVFLKAVVLVSMLVPTSSPFAQPGQRTSGWLVRFSTREAGGGAHRDLGMDWVVIPTPAAIDLRPYLPRDMSARNVFIDMTATTEQEVSQPGNWIYFIKVLGAPTSYTQCMHFEVQSDGGPISGGAMPILRGQSSIFESSGVAQQSAGVHTLAVKLACYFQGGQFPVVTIQVKSPDGNWQKPSPRDFSVIAPYNRNRPPNEQGYRSFQR